MCLLQCGSDATTLKNLAQPITNRIHGLTTICSGFRYPGLVPSSTPICGS